MEGICRKRKRAGDAGQQAQNIVVGMQDVPLPGWIDLSSSCNSPLPPGWEQCLDLQSGKLYFVNTATRIRSLEDPRIVLKEQGIIERGESLSLDLEMRLPSFASMQSKASLIVPPTLLKDVPNHCDSFHSDVNRGIAATNPSSFMAPFNTSLSVTATNVMSSMAATVCMYCHTFVMVCRQSPHCPNCRNVCSMDLPKASTC